MNVYLHITLQVLGFIVQFGTVATNIVPPKIQPFIILIVSAAQGGLAWFNHYYSPSGIRLAKGA